MAFVLKDDLQILYDSLASEPMPEELESKIAGTLETTKHKVPEVTKRMSWEVCLRDDVLNLAVC